MQKAQVPIQQNDTHKLSITWTIIVIGVIALVVWMIPPLPRKVKIPITTTTAIITNIPIVTNLTLEERLQITDRQLYKIKQETAALELQLEELQEEIKIRAQLELHDQKQK